MASNWTTSYKITQSTGRVRQWNQNEGEVESIGIETFDAILLGLALRIGSPVANSGAYLSVSLLLLNSIK